MNRQDRRIDDIPRRLKFGVMIAVMFGYAAIVGGITWFIAPY